MENCRVCLEIPQSPIILNQGDKKTFFQITGVELDEFKDAKLCEKCFDELLVALKFRTAAITADEWFRKQEHITKLKDQPKFEVLVEELPLIVSLKKNPNSNFEAEEQIPKQRKELYICFFCEEKFKRYVELLAHMRIHKKERRLVCRCCNKSWPDKNKLAGHERSFRRKQQQSSTYVCQHCGNIYPHLKGLAMHARIHTDNRPFKCTVEGCSEAFREKRAYYKHFNTTHGIKRPCLCVDCGASYSSHTALKNHRRMYHNDEENLFKCPDCPDRKFLTKTKLESHIAFKHRGERKFACTVCPRGYGSYNNLKRHLNDSHQEMYLEMIRNGRFRKTKI